MTLMRAFSAVAGSWKTTETTRPMSMRSLAVRWVTSWPLNSTLPLVACCRPHITLAVVDLPQPDSPTMPMVWPGMSFRFTLLTAVILFLWNSPDPARVVNTTSTSLSSIIGTLGSFLGVSAAWLIGHLLPGWKLSPRRA